MRNKCKKMKTYQHLFMLYQISYPNIEQCLKYQVRCPDIKCSMSRAPDVRCSRSRHQVRCPNTGHSLFKISTLIPEIHWCVNSCQGIRTLMKNYSILHTKISITIKLKLVTMQKLQSNQKTIQTDLPVIFWLQQHCCL